VASKGLRDTELGRVTENEDRELRGYFDVHGDTRDRQGAGSSELAGEGTKGSGEKEEK